MFFKRKKKIEINSKYKKNDKIKFKYHDEITYGTIINVKESNGIKYDIMTGGQCPGEVFDICEEDIKGLF